MYSARQAAKRLYNSRTGKPGVSVRRAINAILSGKLEGKKVGNSWQVSDEAIEAYNGRR